MQVSSTSISEGDKVTLSPTGSYDSLSLTLKDSSGNETTKTFGTPPIRRHIATRTETIRS